MVIKLNNDLQKQIFNQMEGTFPNEGGGFLLGVSSDSEIVIKDITQIENVFEEEEQFHRYAMTPQDWMKLEDEADEKGLNLVGYYHSHPNAPAIPSEYDREHALPNFVYVITSVKDGIAVDMRVWQLKTDRTAFDNETLIVE